MNPGCTIYCLNSCSPNLHAGKTNRFFGWLMLKARTPGVQVYAQIWVDPPSAGFSMSRAAVVEAGDASSHAHKKAQCTHKPFVGLDAHPDLPLDRKAEEHLTCGYCVCLGQHKGGLPVLANLQMRNLTYRICTTNGEWPAQCCLLIPAGCWLWLTRWVKSSRAL